MVNGLDAVAEANRGAAPVTVTMTVEKKAGGAANAGEITAAAIAEYPNQTLEFLEITVEKTEASATDILSDTGRVLEIVVPYDFKGKEQVTLYRFHGGSAQMLTESESGEDGTYQKDEENGLIVICASKFSTYAIGYTQCYNIEGTVRYGTYTGEVTVSLLESGKEEPDHSATVSMTEGVGAYSFMHVLKGTYTLRTEWIDDGKEVTLEETLNVR
jgi:hypothetical protein